MRNRVECEGKPIFSFLFSCFLLIRERDNNNNDSDNNNNNNNNVRNHVGEYALRYINNISLLLRVNEHHY